MLKKSLVLLATLTLFLGSSRLAHAQTIGADIAAYTPPSAAECDVDVPSQYPTIQSGIDAAVSGDTVCVGPGEYHENLLISKSIRLSGSGASESVIYGVNHVGSRNAAVVIGENSEDGITLEGFKIYGPGTTFWDFTVYLSLGSQGAVLQFNHIVSGLNGSALRIEGNRGNDLIQHNILEGRDSTIVASIGHDYASDNEQFVNNTFTGTVVVSAYGDSGTVLSYGGKNGVVRHNVFGTEGEVSLVMGIAFSSNQVTENNFNSTSDRKLYLSGGNPVPLHAENNWWGIADPSATISGNVDYVPVAPQPFDEYAPPSGHSPIVDAGTAYSGAEGTAILLSGATVSDPDGDTLAIAWSVDDPLCRFSDPEQLHPHLTCDDNGTFIATLTVDDGQSDPVSSSAAIQVANVAPTIGAVNSPTDPIAINNQPVAGISASFMDAGSADTHTCAVDYGDGSIPVAGIIDGGTCSGQDHTYAQAGVYAVTVEVMDDDGGIDSHAAASYIVIYDPTGGFVSGAGWIQSPQGAYSGDASLAGRAIFGFVSKYQTGASTPTGATSFRFQLADLRFKSTSYDWLVVAGENRAKYKGSGSINGIGNFGFMITAVDNTAAGTPDTFRIKIWDMDAGDVVLYDNQPTVDDEGYDGTEIGAGSIRVHRN